MPLILRIENVGDLASGDPTEMILDRHGLIIGRAAHADWTLPDPRNFISSTHCEIDYHDGNYILTDRSTNGTYLNGSATRLAAPHILRDGDLLTVGHYEIRALVSATTHQAATPGGAAHADPGVDWLGAAGGASDAIDPGTFGRSPPQPVFESADDPVMRNFTPPVTHSTDASSRDPFGLGEAPAPVWPALPVADASASSNANADPFGLAGAAPVPAWPAPTDNDTPAVNSATADNDPFGIKADRRGGSADQSDHSPDARANNADAWAALQDLDAVEFAPPETAAAASQGGAAPRQEPTDDEGDAVPAELLTAFLEGAGIKHRDIAGLSETAVLLAAGRLLRQTADGLIRLLEARARVRHQFGVGAQVTTFQPHGNNPLKWTRSPEQAVRQLVGEPDPGFLAGPQAVRGAFEDLQAHELALLAAMQEALAATIERFSPETIKRRASRGGWLTSVLPGAREAALWRAYESEFCALADESEAAYLDLFARHFRKAYERNVARPDAS